MMLSRTHMKGVVTPPEMGMFELVELLLEDDDPAIREKAKDMMEDLSQMGEDLLQEK